MFSPGTSQEQLNILYKIKSYAETQGTNLKPREKSIGDTKNKTIALRLENILELLI